ncbi:MAG: helix-turn-helix transcriptional regulator, partial [Magnetococcales bacterium]|nr:helix-turn-helix transcriptional regulator [Magnetococcales bacterium]
MDTDLYTESVSGLRFFCSSTRGRRLFQKNKKRRLEVTDRSTTQSLSDRILIARKHARLTQKQLADRVGISQTAVHKLECGRSSASRRTVSIALTCGVDPIWLETGRGEMSMGGPGGNPGVSGTEGFRIPVIARIPLVSWEEAKAYTPETAASH